MTISIAPGSSNDPIFSLLVHTVFQLSHSIGDVPVLSRTQGNDIPVKLHPEDVILLFHF